MKCPKCRKGSILQQVSVFVETDAGARSLNKKAIRSKRVKVLGVGWPQAFWYCSLGCGYFKRFDA